MKKKILCGAMCLSLLMLCACSSSDTEEEIVEEEVLEEVMQDMSEGEMPLDEDFMVDMPEGETQGGMTDRTEGQMSGQMSGGMMSGEMSGETPEGMEDMEMPEGEMSEMPSGAEISSATVSSDGYIYGIVTAVNKNVFTLTEVTYDDEEEAYVETGATIEITVPEDLIVATGDYTLIEEGFGLRIESTDNKTADAVIIMKLT